MVTEGRFQPKLKITPAIIIKKEYLITVKGKEIAEKELISLRELVGIASGIVGGTL